MAYVPSYPYPNPQTQYHSNEDRNRLLSITEEGVFLLDGVFRVQDLIPQSSNSLLSFTDSANDISQLEELLTIGTNDTQELGRRIVKLSTTKVKEIGRHHRYQFQALKTIWKYKYEKALEIKAEMNNRDENILEHEDPRFSHTNIGQNLGLKLNLCLLIPLLQAYSESNPEIALSTVQLLFEELSNIPVMSLAKEGSTSIVKLEDLLCHWISRNGESFQIAGASALVALSCARGRLSSLLKTLCVLDKYPNMLDELPVSRILDNLEEIGEKMAKPCALYGENYVRTWPIDTDLKAAALSVDRELGTLSHDMLNFNNKLSDNIASSSGQGSSNNKVPKKDSEEVSSRSYVAVADSFIYVTGLKGKGLSKIGTGYNGLLRGQVYVKNIDLNCGFIAASKNGLVSRPLEMDAYDEMMDGKSVFGVLIDSFTLKPNCLVLFNEENKDIQKPYTTIALTSDGELFYHVHSELPKIKSVTSHDAMPFTTKYLNLYLDVYKIVKEESDIHAYAVSVKPRILLQKNDDNLHSEVDRKEERMSTLTSRSTRATNIQATLQIQSATLAALASSDNYMSSLGVYYRQIVQCMVFTCGNYLTFIMPNYWAPLFNPAVSVSPALPLGNPCSISNNGMKMYAPVMSQHCSRTLGSQIHVGLNGSRLTFHRQDLIDMPINSSFYNGAMLQQMSGAYDARRNLIWTTNGDYVDMWNNPGHIPHWKQNELMLYVPTEQIVSNSQTLALNIGIRHTMCRIMRHISRMGIHFLGGDDEADIGFGPDVLGSLLELILQYLRNFDHMELKSIFTVLRVVISQISSVEQETDLYNNLFQLQTVLFCFISDRVTTEKFSDTKSVYKDTGKLFAMMFDFLHTTSESRNTFLKELHGFIDEESENELSPGRRYQNSVILRQELLKHFRKKLQNPGLKFQEGLVWILEEPWLTRVLRDAVQEINDLFSSVSRQTDEGVENFMLYTASFSERSPFETQYIQSVVNFILRSWVLGPDKPSEALTSLGIETFKRILNYGCMIVERGIEFVASEENLSFRNYLCCEGILKCSILGLAIPQILAFLVSDEYVVKDLEDGLLEECIQLTIAMSHLAEKLNTKKTSNVGTDWSSKIKVPAPWTHKKVIESVHPMKENSKFKETIVIPEARQLFLKFNPQCATQYDYDKLYIYQGCGPNAKKVAECGGNYYGCGNRNFSGPGWPRDLIRIDGNVMTYSCDVRSTRETATTDKAVFGYLFTIYPTFDYSDPDQPEAEQNDQTSQQAMAPAHNGLVTLLSLHCIDVVQKIIMRMKSGNPEMNEEIDSRPILMNGIVSRLRWHNHKAVKLQGAPKKFSGDFISKLKKDAGVATLQIRQSLAEKMRLADFEDIYLQCCLKHVGQNQFLNEDMISQDLENGVGCEIIRTIFRSIETIVRQVMAVSEMEKMLVQEVDDVSNELKSIDEAFFCDPEFLESSSNMVILAMICDLDYDKDTPSNLIDDVASMVQAFIEDGTTPQLTRVNELIEETHLKCQYMLHADPRLDVVVPEPTREDILHQLNDIQSFVFSHFVNQNTTMKRFYDAMKRTQARAIGRVEAFDILLKILQCSQSNSALLTVAGVILLDGPGLTSIACSGLEKNVISRYGDALKAVIELAQQNPLLHRFTVALLCVIRYNKTDELNLVDSGLLGILDQLCAYQMQDPTPSVPITGSNPLEGNVSDLCKQTINVYIKASTLAWAAFRVLASRCASWEKTVIPAFNCFEDSVSNALPVQISANVTNHLARAANLAAISNTDYAETGVSLEMLSSAPCLTDAIQDVLGLLNSLQDYKIGRAILKQSPCICRLLSLLQDPRLSPRLVLTILKLLNTALPLVDNLETTHFSEILLAKKNPATTSSNIGSPVQLTSPHHQVASMLLSKLADFLVCGSQNLQKQGSTSRQVCSLKSVAVATGLLDPALPQVCVWVQKRSDQLAAPVLRQIFFDNSRTDLRPSRAPIIQLETELNTDGRVLLYTEDSVIAERKALRLGQLGCIVSLEPPGSTKADSKSGKIGSQTISSEIECRDKNSNFVSLDPPRPFISGQVAECLASQIVQLLRVLLSSSKQELPNPSVVSSNASLQAIGSNASISAEPKRSGEDLLDDIVSHLNQRNIWSTAVEQVLCLSLKPIPKLVNVSNPTTVPLDSFAFSARLAIASLTVLGAFTETIRVGSEVWIVDENRSIFAREDINADAEEWSFKPLQARVLDISETGETAHVEIIDDIENMKSKKSHRVPLSRLVPCHNYKFKGDDLPNLSKSAENEIGNYLKALLLPNQSNSKHDIFALKKELPSLSHIVTAAGITSGLSLTSSTGRVSESRAIAHGMTVVRLLAEIRTRCMQVLSQWLKNNEFKETFLGNGSQTKMENQHQDRSTWTATNSLKVLAKNCKPSHRINSVENQVALMRLLYRDCTRPPRVAITPEKCDCLNIGWNTSKTFPKVKSCVISTSTNSVVYLGDYNAVGGQPRGLLLYANYGASVEGFYWEATVVTMDESSQLSDTMLTTPSISIGFSPEAVPPEQRSSEAWKYPAGTVLFTTGGRICHYKSQDVANCIISRLEGDVKIKTGDTIGIGWERLSQGHSQVSEGQEHPTSARQNVRPNTPIPPPPPPPPPPQPSSSYRRVRIRNSIGVVANGRSAVPNNSSFGPKGNVFFTLNGQRLPNTIEQSNCGLLPVMHLQKRGVIVSANFGAKPFMYLEAKKNLSVLPTIPGRRRPLHTSASTGSSESGLLLRRVSDSLQDLNMGLNFGAFSLDGIESDSDLEIHIQTESDDTISAGSNDSSELMAMSMDEADTGIEDSLFGDDISTVNGDRGLHSALDQSASNNDITSHDRYRNQITIHVVPPVQSQPLLSESNDDIRLPRTPVHDISPTAHTINSRRIASGSTKCDLIAKPQKKSTEYNPIASLDYFLEASPTNGIRIFSGPNRNICSCSSNSPSILDFIMLETPNINKNDPNSVSTRRRQLEDQETDIASSDEEDDIHSQLVRAWEQHVFPIIRRRFRNESERRDGLEQIRGALQLGMIEIARQTVEFLYEEGGNIPRDLHLPTIEEIRAEATRCTMERVRPGMNVLIRPLSKLSDSNSLLPMFAVPAMLRTFGLVGEVLEIDVAHELVLVETYVESEGILLRFWYPVVALDKPQTSRKPRLNANTVNMFKLHSNLLSLESSLCHMYSRSSFLEIWTSIKEDEVEIEPHGTQSSFRNHYHESSSLQNNLENIQILSDHCLAIFPANGNVLTCNLTHTCPSIKFIKELGNPLTVLYKDSTAPSQEIRRLLFKTTSQGESYLKELTAQFLAVFDVAPEKFPVLEVVADKIGDADIQIPDAAFTLLCVKGLQPPKNAANSVDNVVHSCIHLSCYDSGDIKRHSLVCYPVHSLFPVDTTEPTNSSRAQRSQLAVTAVRKTLQVHRRKLRFPPVLVPTDKIHFSVTDTSLKGLTVHIQGIPSQFPLALLFFQTLVDFFRENESVRLENVVFAASRLVNFICINSMPPLIKEWVISLLTEAISLKRNEDRFPGDFNLFRPNMGDRIFTEMLFIYEKESESVSNAQSYIVNILSEHFTSGKETSGQVGSGSIIRPAKTHNSPGESSGTNKSTITNVHDAVSLFFENNKTKGLRHLCCFSGYFQSLFELCLAINDMHELSFNPMEIIGTLPAPIPSPTPSRKQSGQVGIMTPTSSQVKSRRMIGGTVSKKTSVPKTPEFKKERTPRTQKHQPVPVISASMERPTSAKPSSTPRLEDSGGGYKSFDFEWFQLAERSILALRNFVWNDNTEECIQAVNDVIATACENIFIPTNSDRLIVVYGAPTNIDGMSIETSVLRALKECGGIFGNEIWVSGNSAVLELRCSFKISYALDILKQNKTWYPLDDFLMYPSVNAYRVSPSLKTGDAFGDNTLTAFLRWKILDSTNSDTLCVKADETLSAIFMSCCVTTEFLKLEVDDYPTDDDFLLLNNAQLSAKIPGNLMEKFVSAVKPESCTLSEFTKEIVKKFGEGSGRMFQTNRTNDSLSSGSSKTEGYFSPELSYGQESDVPIDITEGPSKISLLPYKKSNFGLSQNGFLQWCTQLIKDNIQGLWNGIFSSGYDIRFDRAWPMDCNTVAASQFFSTQWTKEKDAALTTLVDSSAAFLRLGPERIHPHEIYLTDADLNNPMYTILQGTPIEYLRVRAAVLDTMHKCFAHDLFPYLGFHKYFFLKRSAAALIHDAKYMMFYQIKEFHIYKLLHATALRGCDSPTPEIFLDPVTALDAIGRSDLTLVHQAIPQLQALSSAAFCVPPSGGSDPALPMNIKYQGEEVLGLSGSFRHFMLNVSKEIQRCPFNVFCKCPSSDAGRNKDNLILHPGLLSYTEEELLYFLGQMMGIAIRSDVTMPFSLIKSGWRSLLLTEKEINDFTDDLVEADVLCATYIKNIQLLASSNEFDTFLSLNGWPKFQYPSMDENSSLITLCPGGNNLSLSYANKEQFVSLIQKLREKELRAENRVNRILAGLATIVPLPIFLNLFTTSHFEFRICGSPEIDLTLLKAHTHYQVGVNETDPHILLFWSALESFTSDELRKFVKFACNLERLPANCPCQSSTQEHQGHVLHVSPFPMKIAPIDTPANMSIEEIDRRLIRVETCLFLIRLPPYSSLQVTRQQLLYAINCRDDPLSG